MSKMNNFEWLQDAPDGMSKDNLRTHQTRLVHQKSIKTFKVIDTCRVSNSYILDLSQLKLDQTKSKDIQLTSFIPAAGAASRYMKPLSEVTSDERLQSFLQDYKGCALPDDLVKFIPSLVQEVQSRPKALFPVTENGPSFLNFKTKEHLLFPEIKRQVFIAPQGRTHQFQGNLDSGSSLATKIIEQDLSLCTLRFLLDGQPYRNPNGELSVVSAGHGALATLISNNKIPFPDTESVFIRNIDNVQGNDPSATDATKKLFLLHHTILESMKKIRDCLLNKDPNAAERISQNLCSSLNIDLIQTCENQFLNSLQKNLFHSITKPTSIEQLTKLFSRPVNTLGQVPNGGTDVGGTPCLIETESGNVKIVLELPHASSDDQNHYFRDPKKATHFNPVIICAEVPKDNYYSKNTNHPFWIIANKSIGQEKVMYHEELLSEILGNSLMCNSVFAELPRSTFNPHKTLNDSKNKTMRDWSF